MLLKSHLLSNCVFVLFLSYLISCQQETKSHQKIIQLLQSELPVSQKASYFVFMVSESDCNACKNSVQRWLNQINLEYPSYQIFGLYHQSKQVFSPPQSPLIKDTEGRISWQALSNPQLLSEISLSSKLGSSPFLIFIKDYKLEYVKSINKE